MESAAGVGGVALIRVSGDIDAALRSIGVAPVGVGEARLRDLMGVDEGLVVRWSASEAHLTPHGGARIVARLSAAMELAGIARRSEERWPEAADALEGMMLSALARAASAGAVDLLLAQPARWRSWDPLAHGHEETMRVSRALRRLIDPALVVAVGAPNVGKSTLLNALVGQKVSIVSDKAQTTRRSVIGVMQGEGFQIAFIDTPGVHEPHTVLGKTMLEAARTGLSGVDLVVIVVDISRRPNDADKRIAQMVGNAPKILAMNKMDRLRAEMVVPHTEAYCQLFGTEDYMMTTATQGVNLDKLVEMIVERLEEGEPQFDSETYTDQTMRFMAAELIREKVLVATRQEVPHACAVHIREWEEEEGRVTIYADILVEKDGQKAILIGNKGQFIKTIGMQSRLEIAELIGMPVHLDLHVKVRPDWRQSPRMIRELEEETG